MVEDLKVLQYYMAVPKSVFKSWRPFQDDVRALVKARDEDGGVGVENHLNPEIEQTNAINDN